MGYMKNKTEKILAIAEGIECEHPVVNYNFVWVNEIKDYFNPYKNWHHTGMLLQWIYKKKFEIEYYQDTDGFPWVAISDYTDEYNRYVIEGENLTLQEAICEAVYSMVKGDLYEHRNSRSNN